MIYPNKKSRTRWICLPTLGRQSAARQVSAQAHNTDSIFPPTSQRTRIAASCQKYPSNSTLPRAPASNIQSLERDDFSRGLAVAKATRVTARALRSL